MNAPKITAYVVIASFFCTMAFCISMAVTKKEELSTLGKNPKGYFIFDDKEQFDLGSAFASRHHIKALIPSDISDPGHQVYIALDDEIGFYMIELRKKDGKF